MIFCLSLVYAIVMRQSIVLRGIVKFVSKSVGELKTRILRTCTGPSKHLLDGRSKNYIGHL